MFFKKEQIYLSVALLNVIAWGFACNKSSDRSDQVICVNTKCGNEKKANPPNNGEQLASKLVPMEPKKVMLSLREACIGCHGTGRDKNSFWALPKELELPTRAEIEAAQSASTSEQSVQTVTTLESYMEDPKNLERLITRLESDPMAVEVFQSIENNLKGETEAIPKAMRPSMDDDTRKRFVALMDELIKTSSGEGQTSGQQTTSTSEMIDPLSLNEAKSWCVGCHSPGGQGSRVFANADSNDRAQWALFALKAREAVSSKLMPPGRFVGKSEDEWKSLLAYFQARFPRVVAEARSKYHGQGLSLGASLVKGYKCDNIKTGREFLNSLTTTALGRPPTTDELKATPQLSEPISAENRARLVDKLETDWRKEFLDVGVRKFADKVTSAPEIKASKLISGSDLKTDIAGEFYQMVRASMERDFSYKQVILGHTVYATKLTAPFYGTDCETRASGLAAGAYVECDLKAPRSTYFTTLGFLAARPSTMFTANNNYTRVVSMNEVITGASLKANTSGEAGFTVKPLPSCLETDDWRGLLNADGTLAPRGTASIPASGNFCQGCHIRRHMAAGAIAFRPFGLMGEVISFDSVKQLYDDKDDATKTAALKSHESALQELLVEAFSEDSKWRRYKERSNQSEPVKLDLDFFKRLMNVGTEAGQEKGCVLERESATETPI
ncbi:MAG: hypothetical protein RIR26_2000, partial [Pseudomonadota bacterium]